MFGILWFIASLEPRPSSSRFIVLQGCELGKQSLGSRLYGLLHACLASSVIKFYSTSLIKHFNARDIEIYILNYYPIVSLPEEHLLLLA